MPNSVVYNCDCLEVMKGMGEHSVFLLTDPPFGNAGGEFKRQDKSRFGGNFDKYKRDIQPELNRGGAESQSVTRTGGTWAAKYGKKIIDWDFAPSKEYFDEMLRVANGAVIFGMNYFHEYLPSTRCFVVWKKLTISEDFSMAMAELAWTNFNDNAKVVECAPQGQKGDPRFHPCSKPVKIFDFCLKHFARAGDIVFDPYAGSGSSRIAAWKAGLDYIGCEIDPVYYAKQEERFERYTSQMNMFVDEMEE